MQEQQFINTHINIQSKEFKPTKKLQEPDSMSGQAKISMVDSKQAEVVEGFSINEGQDVEIHSSNSKNIFDQSNERNFEEGITAMNDNFDKFQIDGADLFHQNLSQNDDDDNYLIDQLEEG